MELPWAASPCRTSRIFRLERLEVLKASKEPFKGKENGSSQYFWYVRQLPSLEMSVYKIDLSYIHIQYVHIMTWFKTLSTSTHPKALPFKKKKRTNFSILDLFLPSIKNYSKKTRKNVPAKKIPPQTKIPHPPQPWPIFPPFHLWNAFHHHHPSPPTSKPPFPCLHHGGIHAAGHLQASIGATQGEALDFARLAIRPIDLLCWGIHGDAIGHAHAWAKKAGLFF